MGAALLESQEDDDGGATPKWRLMSKEAVEKMHAEPKVATDHGLGGGTTEFTQGGVNYYR